MTTQPQSKERLFSQYQVFMIAILAILQFTVILDFMVLSPLGAILMPKLGISTTQFGAVVSGYAFSAGISGLLAAGFADKFDRKKLLMFFYIGFLFGTMLCAMATTYQFLLAARVITGIFGGVLRDLLCNKIPYVFRNNTELYATCSFIGTWIFIILTWFHINTLIASAIGATAIFILRLLAVKFKMTLPAP